MRLLTATALSLTAALFTLSAPADAKPKRKHPVAAKVTPAPINPVI